MRIRNQQKSEETTNINSNINTNKKETAMENKEAENDDNKPAEGKVLPNKSNGGNTEKYMWGQPLIGEISITIPIQANLKGKDLNVKYDSKKISISVKGASSPLIEGEFNSPINVN